MKSKARRSHFPCTAVQTDEIPVYAECNRGRSHLARHYLSFSKRKSRNRQLPIEIESATRPSNVAIPRTTTLCKATYVLSDQRIVPLQLEQTSENIPWLAE